MTPSETIYRKRGRRYVPCYEMELPGNTYQAGHHLTVVRPGEGRMTRYNVNPDRAGLLAALLEHHDEVCKLIVKATEARPSKNLPLTPKQAKAWKAWQDTCGMLYAVTSPAAAEVVDALIKMIQEMPCSVTTHADQQTVPQPKGQDQAS